MYKFRSRPKPVTSLLRPLSGAALLLFTAMSVVAPAQIQHSDARTFSSGLKIKIERNTPPFAALEDNFIDHMDTQPAEVIVKNEELGSSTMTADKVVSRIRKGDGIPRQQTIALKSVSRDEVLQTLFLPLVQSMHNSDADAVTSTIQDPDAIGSASSVSHGRSYAPSRPMSVATVGANALGGQSTLVLPSSAAPGLPAVTTPPAPTAAHTMLSGQTASTEALTEVMSRQISGTIELTDGLALTSPSDQIVVYHEIEDAPSGVEGTVWIRDGRYKIQVDNLTGRLVAELRNVRGEMLGRGQLDLVDLPLQKSQQFRVVDVELKIAPVAQGLAGQVISGNAYTGQHVVVAQAQVATNSQADLVMADARGAFQDKALTNGSMALVKASRVGYWKTLATATTDRLNTLVLLPKALLKSVAQVAKLIHPLLLIDRSTAIIWGHVNSNGQPLSGARALLLTGSEDLTPIYFNEMMIPDPNLKATSSNGLFAFVAVPPGAHVIQAALADHLSEPVAFPTQPQEVSSVDVDMALSRRMTLKSFDAFDPSLPLANAGAKLGSSRTIAIDPSGLGFLRFAPGSSLMVMDFDAQAPYVAERFVVSRDKTHAYLPMVKAEWLDAMRGGVAAAAGAATVVGFVQGTSSYHVLLDSVADQTMAQDIVYFDAQGERTKSGFGEAGGGFVIFNLQEGYRQIAVTADDSDRFSTSVVLADSHVVSVVNHSTH